jgi:serine phosphatase RsbU (regulator of sigma subunit)
VLRGVDRALIGIASGTIATALLARVTTSASGTGVHVEWSNAGHPPPVLIGPDGHAELLMTEPDLLLGFDQETRRHSHELQLDTGATLVLYTDGLVESREASIDIGMTRLVGSLDQSHRLAVERISDLLMGNAASHEEDIALLVLRS